MTNPNIYIGTVIGNDDPEFSGRVKVRIENIDLPLGNKSVNYNYPVGSNIKGSLSPEDIDLSRQTTVWALVAAPVLGESSNGRYNRTTNTASPADVLSPNGMEDVGNALDVDGRETPMGAQFSRMSDRFAFSSTSVVQKTNSYAYSYVPQLYPNASKGVYSVLGVGAKVLVTFIENSIRNPIVIGIINTAAEYDQLYNGGDNYPSYPKVYENVYVNN